MERKANRQCTLKERGLRREGGTRNRALTTQSQSSPLGIRRGITGVEVTSKKVSVAQVTSKYSPKMGRGALIKGENNEELPFKMQA